MRPLAVASISLTLALTTCAAPGSPRHQGPPNILFILTDDHAAHALSCYGSAVNRTPNLDRLATEGVRFSNCFVTNSLCGPSRAVILTGKYSHVNGFRRNGDEFDPSQPTVATYLKAAGYQTAVVGKWHLKSDPQGFDHWNVLPGQGRYYDPVMIDNGERVQHRGYVTDVITDETLDWLEHQRRPDRPFFLMYHHKAPHRRWFPGPQHQDTYADRVIPRPDNLFDDYATRSAAAGHAEMTVAHHLDRQDVKTDPPEGLSERERVEWHYQRYLEDYLRCVASVDDNVGRVLDYLERTGLDRETVVIYTSDQGFFLGDHGWYDKRFMYEESLRSPLLIRYPDVIPAGRVEDAMVLNLDFASTLLELAGQTPPADMQGASFASILSGQRPPDWRRSMYYHYYEYPAEHMVHKHRGVRTERYKLIHFYEIDAWELYDLESDPREMNNRHDDPELAQIQRTLHDELDRLRQQYGDAE